MNFFTQSMQDPVGSQIAIWAVLLLLAGVVLTPNLRTSITVTLAVFLAVAAIGLGLRISTPLLIGTMLGALGLICLLPPSRADLRVVGGVYFAIAIGFYAYAVASENTPPSVTELIEWVVFGVLALLTVGSSVAMVTSRSAVYSAIWFAMALLGTGGLFLYQGAQFLGVATVVVYAGAIVVTFLFVIMLAQPDGHATYDRISWGWFAKPAAALASATLMGAILYGLEAIETGGVRETVAAAVDDLNRTDEPLYFESGDIAKARLIERGSSRKLQLQLAGDVRQEQRSPEDETRLANAIAERLEVAEPLTLEIQPVSRAGSGPQGTSHMANLGGYLFSRHLIAVEVAGTLLLAALVGAIAMLSQSHSVSRPEGDAHV